MDINQIANVAMPIIVGGVAGILIKIIAPIGDIAIDYIKEKIDASGITKQLAKHQNEIATAKSVFYIIEEKYRITEKVEDLLVSKADMFDDLLLQKIPYLTKENLSDLRQALAGEFNKGKQAVITDESLKQSQIELTNANITLTDTNNQLSQSNQQLTEQVNDLTNKLNVINSAISSAVNPVSTVNEQVDTTNQATV